MTDTAMALVVNMREMRDAVRRVLGDKYQTELAEMLPFLRERIAAAKAEKRTPADELLRMTRLLDERGYDPSMLIATFVEWTELEAGR